MLDMRGVGRVVLLVVAIMSGIFSLLREVLQFVDPARYPEKSLFFGCLRAACIVAFGLLWFEERRARTNAETELNNTKPRLVLSLGNIVWIYDESIDKTIFFVSASVVNRGEPSVTLSWRGQYKIGESYEEMLMFFLRDSYCVTVKNERLTFTTADLLNVKTLENPVEKGQFVGGRILVTVPGNRTPQILALQHKIEIQCEDYLGTVSSAVYQPSSVPMNALTLHPNEKVELVTQPESATQALLEKSLGSGS
jgi:hypothetical protein